MSEYFDLPEKLELWTIDTVINLVKKHEFEPGTFDYKSALNPTGPDKNQEELKDSIRRTVCSMANTNGGFILFGVRDRKPNTATPEDRLIGILVHGELLKQFGDKIATIQPEVYFEHVPHHLYLPNDASKGIFVIHIPRSQKRPHMVSTSGVYYRRGENGASIPMNHYEVRDQMMYTEDRLQKVNLLRLKIAQYQETIKEMQQAGLAVAQTLSRFDTGAFEIILADVCGLLPANLIHTLLRIPLQANIVNEYVKDTSSKPPIMNRDIHSVTMDRDGIMYNVGELERLCTPCTSRLNDIFGPLSR